MSLDSSTVKTIAYLARLRIADEQCDALAAELSGILQWVEQLAEVDTDGVAPMTGVEAIELPRRADVVDDGGEPYRVLANAPAPVDDYFAVPKVVE